MNESNNNIYSTAFHHYKQLGLDPRPIPDINSHPSKFPTQIGWPERAAGEDYTEADFAEACNVGNLLGGPKNVTDIDCDSPEAIAVAGEIMDHFMEKTGKTMIFGRESKPRSHYIYECDVSLPSEQIRDPSDGECIVEFRCVDGDGSRGKQTVFPPSQNYDPKTGVTEQVRFEPDPPNAIATVSATELRKRFVMIGAVALLTKHFPVESERHNTILALAGLFARSGMKLNKAIMIIDVAYRYSRGYKG